MDERFKYVVSRWEVLPVKSTYTYLNISGTTRDAFGRFVNFDYVGTYIDQEYKLALF